MTTAPDILERTFPAPPDAFDRLVRRRAKRERTRKIADGALALILVVLLVAALAGALALRRQRPEPLNGPITPSNVSQLGLVWSSPPSDRSIGAAPLAVDDHVFVIDMNDRLRVYPRSCGADVCSPLWSTRLGPSTEWGWGGPVRSGDRVYVPTSSGRIVAYPTTCASAATCDPVWTARLGGDLSSASPVVADGVVYVAANLSNEGVIGAFSESCPSAPRPCAPLWTGSVPGGFIGSQPAVANGVVYVGSMTGVLSAFPTSCARTGGRCRPLWTASPSAAYHAPWSEMIVQILATDRTVFVPVGSALYAYPRACGAVHEPCRPRWVAHLANWINNTTLDGNSVYVSSTDGVLSVFPQSCAWRCTPAWTVDVPDGGGNPTVADGVLYVGSTGGTSAFDAACGVGGGSCSSLWDAPSAIGSMEDFPIVSAGRVYTGADDGRLYVFGLGGSAHFPSDEARDGSQRGQSPVYGLVYGLLLAAVIVWVIRRRRRRDAAPSPEF